MMPDSAWKQWLRDPWRVAVAVLSVILVVVVILLLAEFGETPPPEAASTPSTIESGAPSTTGSEASTPTSASQTTTVSGGEPAGPTDVVATNGLVAVKVDNAPGARPQLGLVDLPLLIEYPVEGGLTRMIAVLGEQSSGHVGPVRSLRPVDADLIGLFAPVSASTGGRPFVTDAVDATGVIPVVPGALGVFDYGDRPAPHNLFLNLDELLPRLTDIDPSPGGLPAGNLPTGEPANSIGLPFQGVGFEFVEGQYLRTQDGEPFLVLDSTGNSEEALSHDTLIVLNATERSAGYFDVNGVEVPTYDVIGGGALTIFNQGTVATGSWLRLGLNKPYSFFDVAGDPIGIPEGRVYVAIVRREAPVTYSP